MPSIHSLHDPLIEESVKIELVENKIHAEFEKKSVEEDLIKKTSAAVIEKSIEDFTKPADGEENVKSAEEELIEKMTVVIIKKSAAENLVEMKTLAARRRVPVRVVLPDQPACLYVVRPQTPLSLLVREAVRGRPWFPIADVSCDTGGSFGQGWRDRRLEASLGRRDAIYVHPAASPRVRIAIVGPHRAGPAQEVTLDLKRSDWSWARIVAAAQSMPEASFGRAVASQWGLNYVRAGRHRRSVSGLRRGRVVELDWSDGWPADWSNSTHRVCDFLMPTSGLRWTGGLTPIVVVWPSCDFFGVREGRLQELQWSDDLLLQPKWVAFFRARRCLSERSREWATFLQLRDGSYCGAESGCVFADEKQLVAKSVRGRRRWRRVLVLLRPGDRVPRCSLPPKSDVGVFRRDGVEMTVERGCVKVLNPQRTVEGSTWTSPFRWFKDELAEAVSGAMRAVATD